MTELGEDSENTLPLTARVTYADRLQRLGSKPWKRLLNVQAPYQAHVRSLKLGRTLDVGCGIGRNLFSLDSRSIGVDHNASAVATARAAGTEAFTTDQFFSDPELAKDESFDSILTAHVVEHLTPQEAREVMGSYLRFLKPGGRFVFITPQERGFASDSTHVAFSDFEAIGELSTDLGLVPVRKYSFPFPRFIGRVFTYNEFVYIARKPASLAGTE